jgi:hypothetical protein
MSGATFSAILINVRIERKYSPEPNGRAYITQDMLQKSFIRKAVVFIGIV